MKSKEIFLPDDMATISTIHFNDYGFFGSGVLAKKYLDQAQGKIQEIPNPIQRRDLLEAAYKINRDCDFLLGYDKNLQNFKTKQTIGFIQRVTKKLVILLSLGDMSHIHSGISYQLRYFHSAICELLSQKKPSSSPNAFKNL